MTGYSNSWSSSITLATLTAAAMQCSVRTVQGAPACPFRVRMGSEWAVVSITIGGTSPRLVFSERGTEGSTAAKHVVGTLITNVVTAADLNLLALATRPQPRARSAAERLTLSQFCT